MAASEPPQDVFQPTTPSARFSLAGQHPGTSAASGNGFVYHHARRAVLAALASNGLIFLMKLGGALFFTNSAALLTEALHSLGDTLNSVTLLFGLTRGNRPPDRSHPFGYGLETSFWALFASIFLFISAGYAVWSGVNRLVHPEPTENVTLAALILIFSMVVEFNAAVTASRAVLEELGIDHQQQFSGVLGRVRLLRRALREVSRVVGPTTRFVFYEDTLALLGAFIALVAIVFGHLSGVYGWLPTAYLHWPDAIAAIVIGGVLLGLALNLLRYNRTFLIGAAAPAVVESKIQQVVLSVHGVSQVYDLKTIDQGMAGLMVHMTVEVDPDTQVKDVDDLTEHIKIKLQERVPAVRQVFIEVLADESEQEWQDIFEDTIAKGRAEGVLDPRGEAMLRNVYTFTESVARDVMVPRTDVEYVELDTPLAEVADLMLESGHTRIPVYKEHVDDVVGIVHAREVFQRIRNGGMAVPLAEVMREVDLYPENKPAPDLLEEFKRKKIQMAVVADEHGGFAGVVTIEDLLEEIVGEIWDEHEVEELTLVPMDEYRVLMSGKYAIEDLNEAYDLSIPDDEFKTIGGFVFGLLGREPEQADTVTFEDLTFTVHEVEGARIIQVMMVSPTPLKVS